MTLTDRRTGFSSSLAIKAPCRLATTANLSALAGYQTIDGVLPTSADPVWMRRILVKDQTTTSQNGVYIMDTGPWERAKDFDSNAGGDFIKGTQISVLEGTLGSGLYKVSSTVAATFIIDTDAITFAAVDARSGIEFVIEGNGLPLTTGVKGYIEVPFAGTIKSCTLLADQAGSVVVNVWKCTYAQFDGGITHPVVGDKITASAPPTITAGTKATDTTLTGWTTTVTIGDIFAFNIDSTSGAITRLTVLLNVAPQ